MPRGKSFRRAPPGHPSLYVRIVGDVNDSTRDRFIAIEDAEPLIGVGKLVPVELGRAYPNSYQYT